LLFLFSKQLVFDDDAAEIKDDDVKWLETLSKKQKKRLLKYVYFLYIYILLRQSNNFKN